jgi:predicted TIM-barrel fold metal-dependent hydrolase
MTIDFHVHLSLRSHLRFSTETHCDSFREEGEDWEKHLASGEAFDDFLAAEGVDLAVGLADNSPGVTGTTTNDYTLERFGKCRRVVLFANLNPTLDRDLPGQVHRLADAGFRGLKLYPTYQHFHPSDPALYPMYEACAARGWPVMFHTGHSVFPGSRLRYADPLLTDDLAVDFPNLTILLCHGGRGVWYDHAALMTKLHKNVYIELSGLPPKKLFDYYPEFQRLAPKMVFGSDWPASPDIRRNIAEIRQLPLPSETLDAILGGTAAKILRLGQGA